MKKKEIDIQQQQKKVTSLNYKMIILNDCSFCSLVFWMWEMFVSVSHCFVRTKLLKQ